MCDVLVVRSKRIALNFLSSKEKASLKIDDLFLIFTYYVLYGAIVNGYGIIENFIGQLSLQLSVFVPFSLFHLFF